MLQTDIYNVTKAQKAFDNATISTDTATNGIIIDTKGYSSGEFLLEVTAFTDGSYIGSVQEGDDSGLSDASAIPADRIQGGLALTAADELDKIGYFANKRYVRLVITSSGTTSGADLSATSILGNPEQAAVPTHTVA